MLDSVTMSDRDGQKVATSSESWDRKAVRLVSDPGLPAPRRDQALALRARPRGHELALEDSAARRRTRPPPGGGHEHVSQVTTQANRERNAPVENDDPPAS